MKLSRYYPKVIIRVFAHLVILALTFVSTTQFAVARESVPLEPLWAAKAFADANKQKYEEWLGFPVRVLTMDRPTQSPMVAMVLDKQCIVILNTREASWTAWERFRELARIPPSVSYEFALLHELGHCVNRLTPAFAKDSLGAGLDSELFADAFALLAVYQAHDQDRARALAQGIIRARMAQQRLFFKGSHDTGLKLQSIVQNIEHTLTQPPSGVDRFELLARVFVAESILN